MTADAITASRRAHGDERIRGAGAFTGRVVVWVVLAVFGILSVVPMIWLILAPSKTAQQLNDAAPFSFGSFAQYGVAWHNLLSQNNGVILNWMANSVVYTASIVVISCVTAVLAGYALAATALPFKKAFLIITLIAMIIPPVALVVPLFVEISAIGLYDNPLSVILTSSFYPFGAFLAYIHFSTSIPTELYEAAKVDGAGEFTTFFRIALPLSRGLFGMLAFFSFSAAWTNYFLPYVLLQTQENFNLSVGLGFLFTSSPALNPANGAQQSLIGRPEIALASLFLAIPVLIVFIASARLLVRGVLAGAVKS
jgi:multiple sugar transport system permease protein